VPRRGPARIAIPELGEHEREQFVAAFTDRDMDGAEPPPWVFVNRYDDPADPSAVAWIAAAFPATASERSITDEPWLVRAIVRSAEQGAPLLSRVCVEHLVDPSIEVTGFVMRNLRLADIRNAAITWLGKRPQMVKLQAIVAGQDVSENDAAWAERVVPTTREQVLRETAIRAIEIFASGRLDVIKALVEETGLGREAIKSRIQEARQLGFLMKSGKRGRAYFAAGPNLHQDKEEGNG
jgi:hypothetical protein